MNQNPNEQTAHDQTPPGQTPYGQTPYGQPGHPTPPSYRRLRRSRTDRMVAGVCGGTAEYLRTDPTLVRVGFAVLTIVTGGAALLAYLVAWLLMPEQ